MRWRRENVLNMHGEGEAASSCKESVGRGDRSLEGVIGRGGKARVKGIVVSMAVLLLREV